MNIGTIQGGTNAGWRKAKMQVRVDWTCPNCGARNRYFYNPCPVCGHPREDD
jgi:rubredoxin